MEDRSMRNLVHHIRRTTVPLPADRRELLVGISWQGSVSEIPQKAGLIKPQVDFVRDTFKSANIDRFAGPHGIAITAQIRFLTRSHGYWMAWGGR